MKVFLSWSGERSKAVAELLNEWLCCVIQAARPWVSTRDLDRGSLWFSEINDQLKDTSVGIICLTQENRVRPWILFEAGALAKGLSTARVCTLLIDLEPKDVEDPLAQFNHTSPTEESMFNLVRTLNTALGVNGLDPRVLEQVFETYWPQFDKKFKDIVKNIKDISSAKPRAKDDLLGEILENTRLLNNRIRRLERAQEEFPIKQNIKNLIEYKLARGNSRENIIEELRSRVPIQIINEILGKLESKNTITEE
ncbi:toll/interleukin-1 receptor domain-containing protein [Haemophilus haemolyticus]|uniref:toll/interleukin-1 receptor domain-containing protein n=1 Tax=Haemophilus haemolyticus TaxID=726 RepID=UPI0008029DD1|nr:toll/interleukin-1 receptor domain-containing protein [Haemophilus haemolyticus]OBX88728.1 toll-Interleukin receptor [Haemophilus haemolyticus]